MKKALNTDKSKTIKVTEFSYEVLSTAVDFKYGIELPEDFNNREDLKSLLHVVDLYLTEDLNKENVFDTSQLADKFWAEFARKL